MSKGYLEGLNEYLEASYDASVFAQALTGKELWALQLHGRRLVLARIVEDRTYEIKIAGEEGAEEDLTKIQVKYLYPATAAAAVQPLIKTDPKVAALGLEPIVKYKGRHFVKNKTLYPLMKERQVVFFTLVEGEVIRGLVQDFSRYDITVKMKGGTALTILRHAIYELHDKKERCLLKDYQDQHRDWEKSALFVAEDKGAVPIPTSPPR